MTLRSVHYDFQQCIMLHIALGNNVATGYNRFYRPDLYAFVVVVFYAIWLILAYVSSREVLAIVYYYT